MIDLDIVRITDYTIAQHIINACWEEISEDGVDHYLPDIVNEYWLCLNNGKDIVGGYRLHQINSVTWQGHVFMIPGFRTQYAKDGCILTLKWLLENTDCKKLIADVPKRYPNVMAFLENIGFKNEGVNRQSFTKDNQLWDIVNYGLTRKEIEELL